MCSSWDYWPSFYFFLTWRAALRSQHDLQLSLLDLWQIRSSIIHCSTVCNAPLFALLTSIYVSVYLSIYLYLFIWEGELHKQCCGERREEIKKNSQLPISLSKCLPWLGLSWAETKSWELNPGLPCGWQQPNDLSHYCCLSGSPSAGSWSEESEEVFNPGSCEGVHTS